MTAQPDKPRIGVASWLVPVLLLSLLVLQVRFWFGHGSIEQVTSHERDLVEQRQANEVLVARNKLVRGEVQSLRESNAAIELAARREFGMVRKGETFYLLVDDAADQQ